MSRTFKDRNRMWYRKRKNAVVVKTLGIWSDDFPRPGKHKDKSISRDVRNKLKNRDKKEIKEYEKGINWINKNIQT